MAEAKEEVVEEGEWVSTHIGIEFKQAEEAVIQDLSDLQVTEKSNTNENKLGKPSEIDDIPDLSEGASVEPDIKVETEDDDVVLVDQKNENLISYRTYDLSVTYDRYYQTPRFWLFGYDEVTSILSDF